MLVWNATCQVGAAKACKGALLSPNHDLHCAAAKALCAADSHCKSVAIAGGHCHAMSCTSTVASAGHCVYFPVAVARPTAASAVTKAKIGVPAPDPKIASLCARDELLNKTSGECVRGTLLAFFKTRYDVWSDPVPADPLRTLHSFESLWRRGFWVFDTFAATVLNHLFADSHIKPQEAATSLVQINTSVLTARGCTRPRSAPGSIAFVVRIKNSAGFNEYVAHHVLLGVTHLYFVVDPDCDTDLLEMAEPWIDAGHVSMHQSTLPQQLVVEAKELYHWVGYIDSDEFVFPHRHHCLADALELYEPYGGAKIKWSVFEGPLGNRSGSLYMRHLPETTIYEAIGYGLAPLHPLTKEIGLSKCINGIASEGRMPHCMSYKKGCHAADDKLTPLTRTSGPCWAQGANLPATQRILTILHVRAISVEEELRRAVRTYHSSAHSRVNATPHIDLAQALHGFTGKHPLTITPMPSDMKRIAWGLAEDMRKLVVVRPVPP